MRAVDTNVVVRWLTRDDPRQTALADLLLDRPSFVSLTVLVETVWVLGGRRYAFTPTMVRMALETLLALDTVTIEAEEWIGWALERYAAGADLPDMLHLVAARGTAGFVSFEKRLAARAGDNTPVPIETLD